MLSGLSTNIWNLYTPLWSYRAIANGSTKALFEELENIILFIPVGVIAIVVLYLKVWQAALLGNAFHFSFERSQRLLWLGDSEVDDLIHNTMRAIS